MRNSGLRLIKPDEFDRQPIKSYPGGYICLIRDVGYGDRYVLMRLRDPKDLPSRLRSSFDFATDLVAAWQAKDAESAERRLRAQLSNGAAQGEWFDLDDERLREHVGHVPRPSAARESATIRPSAAAWQPATGRPPRRRTRRITAVPPAPQPGGERRLATIALALLLVVALLAPSFDGIARLRLPAIPRDAAPKSPRSLMQPTIYRRGVVNSSLLFRWTSVRGANAYEYRWSVNGGKYTPLQQTRALQKSVGDLSPGDVVKFAVRARNGAVKSRFATFTARMPAPKQAESANQEETASLAKPRLNPAKLSTNASGKTTVLFSWQPVSGAAKYTFRWYLNGSGLYKTFSWTRRTEVSICCRSAGDSIRFEVWANRDNRASPVASVTAQVPAEDSSAQAAPAVTSKKPLSAGEMMFLLTKDSRSAHVRECPSTQCSVVGRLLNGALVQPLEIVEGEVVDGSSSWIRIDHKGRTRAFVHAPLLAPRD